MSLTIGESRVFGLDGRTVLGVVSSWYRGRTIKTVGHL